ncbi:hypothetical protein SCHPADRAFT_894238 [Schizopora paradoxa]|uniref:Uncharacterized protein n=1 Tax=Schizopora paradoxa TaxID=27342 RepID=A0A0H2RT05_9AGAM|nr:hypothetical protein SCHPADRAFT_894238 [Schizopora paradoxa]
MHAGVEPIWEIDQRTYHSPYSKVQTTPRQPPPHSPPRSSTSYKVVMANLSTLRDFVNLYPDALVCIRVGRRQHTILKYVEKRREKLERTISAELIQDFLVPLDLEAFISLIALTPNINRLAVHGQMDTWSQNSGKDLLNKLCLVLIRNNYPSLDSIVLDCHSDLTNSIRGTLDVRTMRFRWTNEQFTFATPISWIFLRNLCIEIPGSATPWPNDDLLWPGEGPGVLGILTKDSIRNLKRLDLRLSGRIHQGVALIGSVAENLEELVLFFRGKHYDARLPNLPKVTELGCYPASWVLLQETHQPELKTIKVYGGKAPSATLDRYLGTGRDGSLEYNVQQSTELLSFLRKNGGEMSPNLKDVHMQFLTETSVVPGRLRDQVATWKEPVGSEPQFLIRTGQGITISELM